MKIGAEDCGEEGDAEEATEKKLLSQMKQLELSGTAGNILLPATDEAEVHLSYGLVCLTDSSQKKNQSKVLGTDAYKPLVAEQKVEDVSFRDYAPVLKCRTP